MKRILTHMSTLLLAACILGCERTDLCPDVLQEICFDSGLCLDVDTKAMSERTSAAGFTCMALRSDGSTFISNAKTSSGTYETISGRYWPASGTLSFFGVLPNVAMTNSSGTVTCPVGSASAPLSGAEDFIVAKNTGVPNSTSPVPMQFGHILSQVSGLKLTGSRSGASTTITSASFSHPTYGTYNLSSGSWSSTGGSANSSFTGFGTISGTGTGTAGSDFSVIPGTYTLSVSYTVSVGGASRSYTKSGQFTLTAGKKSTISATLSDDFLSLAVSVSVAPWNPGTTWSDDCVDDTKPAVGGDEGSESVPTCSVELNAAGTYGWTASPYTIGNSTVYQSANEGVSSSMSVMSVTLSGYTSFTFNAYTSGESNYDYILVSKPGTDLYTQITGGGGWKNLSSLATLSNVLTQVLTGSPDPLAPDSSDNYTPVTLTDLDADSTYTFQIIFGKDGSINRGLDKGFIYIP